MSIYPRQLLVFLFISFATIITTHFAYHFYKPQWITYRTAENYYAEKEWKKAIDAYQESLSQGLEHPVAWLRLGHAYTELKEYQRALIYYKKYMDLRPKELWVKKVYAGLLTANGQFEEAQKFYQDILKQETKDP